METNNLKSGDLKSNSLESKTIPRPDVSVAQIILLILTQTGQATFRDIAKHPQVKLLGALRSENSFYTALARLKRRRLITRTADRDGSGHQYTYQLTSSGEYAALKAYVRKEFTEAERPSSAASQNSLRSTSAKAPSFSKLSEGKWDGKWRIVLFDMPEGKRPLRDYLRGVLKRFGFQEFQRSMWVWPHKLPAFLQKLLADPQIRSYARAITTYDIDYDEDLRRKFRLL